MVGDLFFLAWRERERLGDGDGGYAATGGAAHIIFDP
jgi:hypothetical protein